MPDAMADYKINAASLSGSTWPIAALFILSIQSRGHWMVHSGRKGTETRNRGIGHRPNGGEVWL